MTSSTSPVEHPTGWVPDGDRRPPVVPASGPVLFARYAYPPNSLGYCGPGDPSALLGAAAEGTDVANLGQLAARFEGAWPYLQLIAACNGLDDPLDRRVVEAYWVGNELIAQVPPPALANSLGDRFEQRSGRRFAALVSAVPAGGIPQHSFHVFAVYPWLGMLWAGMEGAPLEVLDRCRIRWGRVADVAGDVVAVSSQPLEFVNSRLVLGAARLELARRALDGVGFVDGLRVGDAVSLHWDWVCDRLDARSLGALRAATRENLRAVNTLRVPGPAVAADAWS